MKMRGLIIAAVVLAALIGTLYWSNHRNTSSSVQASADTPPKILSLNEGDIRQIDLQKKGAGRLQLAKSDSGWQIVEPKLAADQSAVQGMVSTLASLGSDRLIEDKAGDLQQYGLADPALQVAVGEKNGKTQTLLVGDDTPAGNASYVALKGDPRVFTIASYTKSSIDKSAGDLRDKRLVTVPADKVSRLELVVKSQNIEFGRNKDEWQILKPRPLRADSSQVSELIGKLADAKMDVGGVAEKRSPAVLFDSGKAVATAKLTDASGTQELQIRKNKDDYYAKSSIVAGVYKVPSDVGQAVDKRLDDFRARKVFDFGYADPNAIQFQGGANHVSLSRSGQDWLANGKKADPADVTALLDALRNFSAKKLLDAGSVRPEMDFAVTTADGKRVERVQIGKSGGDYMAKRDGDATLYQLDVQPVEDARRAAEKLAQAPGKPPQK
jgi:hypothetical protein